MYKVILDTAASVNLASGMSPSRQRIGGTGRIRLQVGITLTLGLLLLGCSEQNRSKAIGSHPGNDPVTISAVSTKDREVTPGMQASPLEDTNVLRSFLAKGLVRELPAGFMPKMTMSFDVRDTNELRGLKPGDAITFIVKATEEDSWIEKIRPAATNDLTPLPPSDPSSAALLHVAQMKQGDVLPDAELLSEDGSAIKLSRFQGQALAFTFIFTRCPLPDYCPRMNQHFSRARELLLKQSDGPTNWQFLSISFDPEFDKPGVLSRYAYSYRGKSADRWLFAAAPTNVMSSFVNQLDFRFANEGGSFLHNLRTVVLDPQRRIHRQFDGNKWKADELAQALAEAAVKR
jgi:protein SCO1/2